MGQHVLPSVGVQPAAELRHVQGPVHELHVLPRVGVQPAAQLRHVQRHDHVLHVLQRKFPVRRQQAAHPLRVGGYLGLRLRWLWLELGTGKLRLRQDRLECCSSDFENSCCCTYYGEKRESGAALLPPTSLIAANKRDCLPDSCFLYTQGGQLHRHANLSAVTGAQSPPRLSDTVRRGCTYAAGAVSKCVWQDPMGGGPPEIGCYEVKPLQKRSIFNRGSGQRKRSKRLLKSCLRPTRGVVEGGRWTWVIGTGCVCLVGCGYPREMPAAGVGVLSWPDIALVAEL